MQRRWYELSADVCIIVSMIEMSKTKDKERYAKKIITELIDSGYKPDPDLYEICKKKYPMTREYDSNKEVFLAIEYLKNAQKNIQDKVISRLTDYMRLSAVS